MSKRDFLIVLILWFIVTSFNIFKSFQIDDPFYIEEAQWILKQPLKPLSGEINWMQYGKPIYSENNPVLIPYLIAAVGSIFGFSEVSLHIITAFFSFVAIYFLLLLFKRFSADKYVYFLTIMVLHPIFIVNQNVMLEIPFLAVGVMCFYLIFNYNKLSNKQYLLLSLLFSLLILIKYTAFPVLMLFILHLFFKNEKSKIVYLIPVLITILLWSLWNMYDFNGIHLLNKKTNLGFNSDKIFTSLICLGSILITTSIFIFKGNIKMYLGAMSIYFGASIIYLFNIITLEQYFYILLVVSILIGFGVFIYILFHFKKSLRNVDSNLKIISSFLVFYLIFIVLTAPFMATRYFLIIMPLILILFSQMNISQKWLKISTISTVIFGMVVGFGDYSYAHFYENEADFLAKKYHQNPIVTVGHNGWQYYSKKNGMIFYDKNKTKLEQDNIVIIPVNTHNQDITIDASFVKIESYFKQPSLAQRFIGRKNAMFGSNYMNLVPFVCNNLPVDTFHIYQIKLH